MRNSRIERMVKTQRERVTRKLNKEVYTSPWFEDFWRTISRRTTYRVALKRDEIIHNAVAKIKAEQPIPPLRVQVTRAGVKLMRGGTKTSETVTRSAELSGTYQLPDIISELQEATSLTRKTLVDVLTRSGKLDEFIGNPNDFIAMVKRNLQTWWPLLFRRASSTRESTATSMNCASYRLMELRRETSSSTASIRSSTPTRRTSTISKSTRRGERTGASVR